MKLLLMALMCLFLMPQAFSQSSPDAKDGVENGTCWKDADDNVVHVKVRGLMSGGQRVTMTLGDDSQTLNGTPVLGGGCLSTVGAATLGGHDYRIHGGEMERENSTGDQIRMQEVDCPKTCTNPNGPPPPMSGDDLGTLPRQISITQDGDGFVTMRDLNSGDDLGTLP